MKKQTDTKKSIKFWIGVIVLSPFALFLWWHDTVAKYRKRRIK